jgi:hypothetical protein
VPAADMINVPGRCCCRHHLRHRRHSPERARKAWQKETWSKVADILALRRLSDPGASLAPQPPSHKGACLEPQAPPRAAQPAATIGRSCEWQLRWETVGLEVCQPSAFPAKKDGKGLSQEAQRAQPVGPQSQSQYWIDKQTNGSFPWHLRTSANALKRRSLIW